MRRVDLTSALLLLLLAVTDPSDAETRKAVRAYVQRVSQLMVVGNLARMREQFGESVPGPNRIAESRGRKATITVHSSAPDEGSHIIFSTRGVRRIEGLHEFLRFQINDLKTGDSLEVRERGGLRGAKRAPPSASAFSTRNGYRVCVPH